ncbi:hypothetical protein AB0C27_08890 [Nonomuraea sp. NPDC048882]|uniref:hypothetical protein n=1 Tax=Nonomuraea sp. NPDC048882 TaxID=3154347 RepID=UPI003403A423
MLARCLRDSGGHEEAFRRFEAERRPRVERVVAYSRTISKARPRARSPGWSAT